MEINTQLFDEYCDVARELLADLAKVAGESYEPSSELSARIQKVRSISSAVAASLASLQPAGYPPVSPAATLEHNPPVQPQAQAPAPPTMPA
jgi:hypothetical protein